MLAAFAFLLGASAPASAQPSYVLFESGPVRPVALSPDASKLFVTNIPDGTLEIFDVSGGVLTSVVSVPVGLEPVAVAAKDDTEVWVVNHLSDSVSIVDVASSPPRVVRTLLVGDEPRDIVFAGSPKRAFISTAHRGQHRTHASISGVAGAGDPQLTTEGIGRADVWVFDATTPGSALGGVPVAIKSFFADTPRALATDGTTVYVAAHHSGNQTTVVPETSVLPNGFTASCGGGGAGQGVPVPANNVFGDPAPETGLIVKFDGANWVDALGCTWNDEVELSLPDHDVFAFDANTLAAGTIFDHVGTILFNMAINPSTGKLYVTGTESPNHVRFEGPGNHGGSTVQGHLSESRVSVIDPAGPSLDVQHLNQHIDYSQLHTDAGANHAAIDAQIPHSLATPLQVLVDDASQKVYVAAFGSAKVGVFDVAELEDPSFEANFDPTSQSGDYLATGGGPAGLALDTANDHLFVYERFANTVSVYDVSGAPAPAIQTVRLHSPEPASVVEGRPVLYDAVATSGNGETSCSSCHVFGDFDSLAWNLGDPDAAISTNNQPAAAPLLAGQNGTTFHPMKGPMTTQTLRGLSTHGATHWRGDRLDGFFGTDACTGSSESNAPCDERQSFDNFIVAFEGLVGHDGIIAGGDMQKFTDFALRLMIPPNPVAQLDGSRTAAQQAGHDTYFSCGPGTEECNFNDIQSGNTSDTVEDCDGCHNLDPASGFFGTGGDQSFENEPQTFKVAHLRNVVQKVGMFGLDGITLNTGPQVRGVGFLHDGSVDTLFNFLEAPVFSLSNQEKSDLEQFMLAFPSDLAPVVGQQVSLGPGSPGSTTGGSHAQGRVTLLDARAGTAFVSFVLGGTVTECDLVVKTVEGGVAKGYVRQGDGTYLPDDGTAAISEAALRVKSDPNGDAQDLQYTCVPPGSGLRAGIDRDQDAVLDGQDNCPAWPNGASLGTCTAGDAGLLGASCSGAVDCGTGGVCSQAQEDANGNGTGDACEATLLPEPGRGAGAALGVLLVALISRRARRAPAGERAGSGRPLLQV